MKKLAILLFLGAVGCTTPHKYQDPVDPSVVTQLSLDDHAIYAEDHYQKHSQVEGIVWQRYRSDPSLVEPDKYGNGGDSCIFTGHKLAIDVYRYGILGRAKDLEKVAQSLRGLYIMTHITGTPGVICRNAFPASRAAEWNYPERWSGRNQDFVHTSSSQISDPFGGNFPAMTYYTRATKDQLTGLIFGLSVAWAHLDAQDAAHDARIGELRLIIAQITEDVYNHLRDHDWKIRDEKGANDTNADGVKGLLKTAVYALYRKTATLTSPHRVSRITDKYQDSFAFAFYDPSSWFNLFSNYSQYYAWNLRYLRSYSIYILEDVTRHQKIIQRFMRGRLWHYTQDHYNSKFIYLYNAVSGTYERLDDAYLALQSLSIKPLRAQDSPLADDERKPGLLQVIAGDWARFILLPHLRKPTSYSTWQKEPWDTGHSGHNGVEDTSGLDYLMAYWLRRFHGF
jgi:hypothetical protein